LSHSMSKKVGQADLRKLMQKVQQKDPNKAGKDNSKKYKLSGRELRLLEEQKREKEAKEAAKKAKEASRKESQHEGSGYNSSLPQEFFDAKPKKSILKNKSAGHVHVWTSPAAVNVQPASQAANEKQTGEPGAKKARGEDKSQKEEKKKSEAGSQSQPQASTSNELPAGFFDDPKLDAKVRLLDDNDM